MSDPAHLHEALLALSDADWVTTVQRMSWYCRHRSARHVPEFIAQLYLPTPEEWPTIRHEARLARRRQAYRHDRAVMMAAARAAREAGNRAREQRRVYMRKYMRDRRNRSQD